jgi:hypothetical protein
VSQSCRLLRFAISSATPLAVCRRSEVVCLSAKVPQVSFGPDGCFRAAFSCSAPYHFNNAFLVCGESFTLRRPWDGSTDPWELGPGTECAGVLNFVVSSDRG